MTEMLTTATRAVPHFLDGFAAMHAAMRRDAARLPGAIAAADEEALEALATWFRWFRSTLVHHHEREDEIVWPALLERDPTFGFELETLAEDHAELDRALAEVEAALGGDGDAGASAAHLATVLVDHLAREEAAAFPRLASCFAPEEWEAVEH